jgi:hypothetical protein
VIKFDPIDVTNKHKKQASWKRVAMIQFYDDSDIYYQWFLCRRYNLKINRPLRGSHVTFINDSKKEITGDWYELKKKYHNTEISVTLDLEPKTDSNNEGSSLHWWLKIPEENRGQIHSIREEIGLGRPYWGLHMSLGYVNEKHQEHSKYIHRQILRHNL